MALSHLSAKSTFLKTQQTCLLCDTADMSAVCHSIHVCCVTQQTCVLCDTADMSAVSHSRHGYCVTEDAQTNQNSKGSKLSQQDPN